MTRPANPKTRKSAAKTPARSTSKLERTPGHGALEQERMRSMLPRCRLVLGPRGADTIIDGTDFAVIAADGRIASVTGFLDRIPQQ